MEYVDVVDNLWVALRDAVVAVSVVAHHLEHVNVYYE
jgi:hypothetical protein